MNLILAYILNLKIYLLITPQNSIILCRVKYLQVLHVILIICDNMWIYMFFLINVGIQASLRASRLIPRILKLTTMKVSSDHHINNHIARIWDHRESKLLSLKLLSFDHLLDGYDIYVLFRYIYDVMIYLSV
jgi:hypothetical protein